MVLRLLVSDMAFRMAEGCRAETFTPGSTSEARLEHDLHPLDPSCLHPALPV